VNLAAKIGASFREELQRPGTQVYVLGSTLLLLVFALLWKTGHADTGYLGMARIAFGAFSPIIAVSPIMTAKKLFWKRFALSVAIHAVFLLLVYLMSGNAYFHGHSDIATWLFLFAVVIEIAFIVFTLNRVFPLPHEVEALDKEY
jgi:hypothetical protein